MDASFVILQSERSQFDARGLLIGVENASYFQNFRDLDEHRGDTHYLTSRCLGDVQGNSKDVRVGLAEVDKAGDERIHKPVKLEPSNPISIQFVCFLAQADVGFAIGTGTEVAIEASNVKLIKGSLMCIITAIEISRAMMPDNARQCAMCARTWSARLSTTRLGFRWRWASCIRLSVSCGRRCGNGLQPVTVVTNAKPFALLSAEEDVSCLFSRS
jgi:hypothetical protein